MLVQAATFTPLRSAASQQSQVPPAQQPPEEQGEEGSKVATVSRVSASILSGLRKVPTAYRYVPGLLRFALVDGLITAVQVSTGALGIFGMVGMGLAGALEIRDGVRQNDPVKMLAGSGEIARGAFVGSLSAEHFFKLGPYEGVARGLGVAAGLVHGGLNLSSGLMKYRRGAVEGNRIERLEGLLETGMAACTLVAVTTPSPVSMTALGAHVALSTGRYVLTHQEQLKRIGGAIRHRSAELWNNFKDIFREQEPEKSREAASP